MPEQPVTATLLISCRDQKGLVAAVSDFLYRNDGNIIHADQHTDQEESVFLQRVEWQLAEFAIPRENVRESFQPLAERFDMTWSLNFSDEVPRVAIFVSKLAHCMYDLLARWRMGEFRAEVPLIISNHAEHADLAESFGARLSPPPEDKREKRAAGGAGVVAPPREAESIVIVLARYMQVLSPEFVARWPGRIINIHHSFLPAFAGAQAVPPGARARREAHRRDGALRDGRARRGPDHRAGRRARQPPRPVDDLVRKGRDLEKTVLARAVDLHLRNRVVVYGNKTVVFD